MFVGGASGSACPRSHCESSKSTVEMGVKGPWTCRSLEWFLITFPVPTGRGTGHAMGYVLRTSSRPGPDPGVQKTQSQSTVTYRSGTGPRGMGPLLLPKSSRVYGKDFNFWVGTCQKWNFPYEGLHQSCNRGSNAGPRFKLTTIF